MCGGGDKGSKMLENFFFCLMKKVNLFVFKILHQDITFLSASTCFKYKGN